MTGEDEGTFENLRDFSQFLQHSFDKATNYEASNWHDPTKHATIPENMHAVINACKNLHISGYNQPICTTSIQVNTSLKDFAKKSEDFDWGWWRIGKRLFHDDGSPIGNDKPSLLDTIYLEDAALIKHEYTSRPTPIVLDTVRFEQNGVSALMGTATCGELDSICSVPWMDPKMTSSDFAFSVLNGIMDENKWQRVVSHIRIKQIREFAENDESSLFNPVLLYVDDSSIEISELSDRHTKITIPFDFLNERYGVYTDYFPIPEDIDSRPIWIIDGQHRIRGFGSSKRGSRLPIPFVLIVGTENNDNISKIAKLFTEINTKSEELSDLHKIFLNYRYGMISKIGKDDVDFSVEKLDDGTIISDSNGLPLPTQSSKKYRKAYELALNLACMEESPLYNTIEFQSTNRNNAKYVSDAKKWILDSWSGTSKWFSTGIYRTELDSEKYCLSECLNFFLAFQEICRLPSGPRWEVGTVNNKQLFQRKGTFPVLLKILSYSVEQITKESVNRPIPKEKFIEFLNPISKVDWRYGSLIGSRLTGQNNTNWTHLYKWITTAIENGVAYENSEVMDPELKSIPGKGLIALPKREEIEVTTSTNFPDIDPLILKVPIPYHCTSLKWEIMVGEGEEMQSIDSDFFVRQDEDGFSYVTIPGDNIDQPDIQARVLFINGMGTVYSTTKHYSEDN